MAAPLPAPLFFRLLILLTDLNCMHLPALFLQLLTFRAGSTQWALLGRLAAGTAQVSWAADAGCSACLAGGRA